MVFMSLRQDTIKESQTIALSEFISKNSRELLRFLFLDAK
jgi:hypothetical protein